MKTNPLHHSLIKIGIIGLGNIGSAVAENVIRNHAAILQNRGIALSIAKVCDIRRRKINLPLTDDPAEIINDPDISVVVEAIGGEKPAAEFILAALKAGKHVVTPNKEVIAKHLPKFLTQAKKSGVQLRFEAAVGGGIPIIAALQENLVGSRLNEVYGIVNGTTNYILSRMLGEGIEFAAALKGAQAKGYAEQNPAADIAGQDAAYKAVILAASAFRVQVDWKQVYREGIKAITQEDIHYAFDIGYVIKLLAIVRLEKNKLDVRVHPALVVHDHPLASVSDNYNAIYVKGEPVGQLMFYGPGAGGGPTASAIIGDVIRVSEHQSIRISDLKKIPLQKIGEISSRYYLRLQVLDRPGVLADIARIFARHNVSLAAVTQKEVVDGLVTIVILTHEVNEKNLQKALSQLKHLAAVRKIGNVIRII
ncbi:homoserine dehydrogenase [Candidatus Saganbacteria bacterium]|nr:homoserine dehydrogenase [Candidatus Saganbacteria bacterium]